MLSFWLYRSTACVAPRSTHEGLIYLQSKDHNTACRVSGFLHREDGCFVQYLEGPTDEITALRRRVHADWRHRDVRTLAEGALEQRCFHGWDMALSDNETAAFKTYQSIYARTHTLPHAPADDILAFVDHLSSTSMLRDDTKPPPRHAVVAVSAPSAAFPGTMHRSPERSPS